MESFAHPLPIFKGSHFLTEKSLKHQLSLALSLNPGFREDILGILETSTPLEEQIDIEPAALIASYSDLIKGGASSLEIAVWLGDNLNIASLQNEYAQLIAEHTELINGGTSSVEIARWLGGNLNIASWKIGAFHGEYQGLPTPTPEEMIRLNIFSAALNIPAQAIANNGGSGNHPQFFLINGYSPIAFFGEKNARKMHDRSFQIDSGWRAMGHDCKAKEQYLLEKVGLDIKGDWKKLTGVRDIVEDFMASELLYASSVGSSLSLTKTHSDVLPYSQFRACLCFLA